MLTVHPLPVVSTHSDTILCRDDSLELWVDGGFQQVWSPDSTLSDPLDPDPIAFPDASTQYGVSVTDSNGCQNSDSVHVALVPLPEAGTSPDTFMCKGDTMEISGNGGTSYQWTPSSFIDDPSSKSPHAYPPGDTDFKVMVSDNNGCTDTASITLLVDTLVPQAQVMGDTLICKWDSIRPWASGGHVYEWGPDLALSDADSSRPLVHPNSTTSYQVEVTNGCGSDLDSVRVTVKKVESNAGPDSTICPGDSIWLGAEGGTDYRWEPSVSASDPNGSETQVFPSAPTDYRVFVTDANGCKDTGSAFVDIYPKPDLWAGEDRKVEWGSRVVLHARGEKGNYLWHPESFFEDPDSRQVSYRAKEKRTFWVEMVDSNYCRFTDSLLVEVSGSLYAPNAFTPDGDGINDVWRVKGEAIGRFELKIFDRWGELLFQTDDINEGWNGKVDGHPAKPDVYVYRIVYTEAYEPGVKKELVGHITLVR
jgi:gliding motility-associated-like protein